MSVPLTVGGTTFNLPIAGGLGRGPDTIGWASAVTNSIANATSANLPYYNAAALGIVPTNTGAQNLAAWEAFQAGLLGTTPSLVVGGTINFPRGIYDFSDTFHVRYPLRVVGAGGWGSPITEAPTMLRFPAGVTGVVFEGYTLPWAASTVYGVGSQRRNGANVYTCITDGTTASSGGPSGTSSNITDGTVHWAYVQVYAYQSSAYGSMEDMEISGVNSGTNTLAHGIDIRTRAMLTRVFIQYFRGNGINITADVNNSTNANGWIINVARIYGVGGHGVYIAGGDVNAGTSTGIDVGNVGGYGIYDSSFLGNTHIGPEIADARMGAVRCDGLNARSVFVGLYTEGGQPPSVVNSPSMVLGGLQGTELHGTGLFLLNNSIGNAVSYASLDYPWAASTYYTAYQRVLNGGRVYVLNVDPGGTSAASGGPTGTGTGIVDGTCVWNYVSAEPNVLRLELGHTGTVDYSVPAAFSLSRATPAAPGVFIDPYVFTNGTNTGGWQDAYSYTFVNGQTAFYLTHRSTTVPAQPGKYVAPGSIAFPNGYYVGVNKVTIAAAAPTTGTYDVGDDVRNTAPAASGYMGWVCITAGTAGSYTGGSTATTNGTTTVTLSTSTAGITTGDFLVINATAVRVVALPTSTTITVSAAIAAGAGLTITHTAPVLKTYGAISP